MYCHSAPKLLIDPAMCSHSITISAISIPGVQSGSASGEERPRADGRRGRLHGLQHRHPTHRDPERSDARLDYQLSEETPAGQGPVL